MPGTNYFHVPFRDERCDYAALMDAYYCNSGHYIPRDNCDLGIHDSNKDRYERVSKKKFSDIRNGDVLWIAGHGARFSADKIAWIRSPNNIINFTAAELAKWIGNPLKQQGVTQLDFVLLSCFSGNNWFGTAFGGKFAAALRGYGIRGSVTGFKGVLNDEQSFRQVGNGGAVTKGSSRINYAAHSVLNGIIQVGSLGCAKHHEAGDNDTGNKMVYTI